MNCLRSISIATCVGVFVGAPGLSVAQTTASSLPAVVATVNGEPVTSNEWLERMQNLTAQEFILSANPLRFRSETGGRLGPRGLRGNNMFMKYAAKVDILSSAS